MSNTLKLIQGSAESFDIALIDKNKIPYNLSGITAIVVDFKELLTDTSASVSFDTVEGTLEYSVATGVITCNPTQAKADAYPIGTFIAEVAVQKSGEWTHLDNRFTVKITPAVSRHI